MIQSERNSLHRQRHRNKLFVPSKFHHSLQQILIVPHQGTVSVIVRAVRAVCSSPCQDVIEVMSMFWVR